MLVLGVEEGEPAAVVPLDSTAATVQPDVIGRDPFKLRQSGLWGFGFGLGSG